ncbi:NAD-dependent epimerase/dehydratase family protein [uncultured Brevibacillus sp.]|uniref:NAD-dependent epimerase/dehydratase family protein n=1 Tax=uncultured Brevibacillus sp. TaxID=169970 RepID=UPI00338FC5C7
MRILLLGGTRFIGPHVVKRLAEYGHELAIFNRGLSSGEAPLPKALPIRWCS